ncbi:MAG: hypothetical protein HYS15_01730 [Candidatus Spechtbacteria bacterium]|nr:hypothetical protein [Candidatus Spechtbacteria bacterium]
MGALTVTKAHLQYAQSFMASPIPYPQIFFEDAKIFFVFFPLMDQKATTTAIMKVKNANIEPSCLGQIIVRSAKQNFVTDQGAFMPLIMQEFDKDTQKLLQHFATHLFLNLAAWYICPLFAANNYFCPYMPRSWILKFLNEKKTLKQNERTKYADQIIMYLAEVEKRRWVAPYVEHAGKLGRKGTHSLLLLIGMFLEAQEKEEALKALFEAETKTENPPLDTPVLEFLETLDLEDFEGKK